MNNDATITNYFEAAGELLKAGLVKIMTEDKKGYEALNHAVAAGAIMSLRTAVCRSGIVELRCTVDSGDDEVLLFSIDGNATKFNQKMPIF